MSVELLDSIKNQTRNLSAREKAQLADYLLRETKAEKDLGLAGENTEETRLSRMKWLKANREKYAGQYVALDGDKLVGRGKNYPEAARQAKKSGVKNAFVIYVYPVDYVAETGGWR